MIELRGVEVALNGRAVLRNIHWALRPGQHWMIHGPNGCGKSTFLRLLRGEVWPAPGKGERLYRLDGVTQMTAIEVRPHIALVSPEIQERYLQMEWQMSCRNVIQTGFAQSDMLYIPLTRERKQAVERLAGELGIRPLLDRDMQSLSTGELRKVLIARAVVGRPAVLLLDEVCDGLDATFRAGLLQMLEVVARHGTQIIYTTHRDDEPLSVITHELSLAGGEIKASGPARPRRRLKAPQAKPASPARKSLAPGSASGSPLIRIENADVFLDRQKVLRGIRWQWREGEHWVVLGGNGAGKTTFLKLIASDLYPAFGARVSRFEFTAEDTIWDLRARIGCVSPLLQAQYREQVTGVEVVATGFHASVGFIEKPAASELRRAAALLKEFGLERLGPQSMLTMSFGEIRKILTLRALVHEPKLLIFDEPFDGLDAASRQDFARELARIASRGTQLLIVTHHLDDLPPCMTHGVFLEQGQIVLQDSWAKVRRHEKVAGLFGQKSRR